MSTKITDKTVTSNGWSKKAIQTLLDTNDRAVCKALLTLYKLQTEEEKAHHKTVASNGVGFSSFDAEFLSSLAEQVKEGGTLSPRQLEIARKKTKTYWRQLLTVASASAVRHP